MENLSRILVSEIILIPRNLFTAMINRSKNSLRLLNMVILTKFDGSKLSKVFSNDIFGISSACHAKSAQVQR